MSDHRIVVLELSEMEVAHLAGVVRQFADLLASASDGRPSDGLARLTPDAYPDDADASEEFARFTRDDLLARRGDDAGVVLRSLSDSGEIPDPERLGDEVASRIRRITLDDDETTAWLRSLAAVRLVLASRLGIRSETDGAPGDPRFFMYEWLGATLNSLVRAVDRSG